MHATQKKHHQTHTPRCSMNNTRAGSGRDLPEHIKQYAEEFQRARSFEDDDLYFPSGKSAARKHFEAIAAMEAPKDTVPPSTKAWKQQEQPHPAISFYTPQKPCTSLVAFPEYLELQHGARLVTARSQSQPASAKGYTLYRPNHFKDLSADARFPACCMYSGPCRLPDSPNDKAKAKSTGVVKKGGLNGGAPVFRSRSYTTSPLRTSTNSSNNCVTTSPAWPSQQLRTKRARGDRKSGLTNA